MKIIETPCVSFLKAFIKIQRLLSELVVDTILFRVLIPNFKNALLDIGTVWVATAVLVACALGDVASALPEIVGRADLNCGLRSVDLSNIEIKFRVKSTYGCTTGCVV